ncbi:MAG: hypothetical protein HZA31_05655 [Opitutae bacterium]|nr:hypothetical protein [Opitutae bacterium]
MKRYEGHHFGERPARMSREVLTPLLIAAGAIGLPLLIGVAQCSRTQSQADAAPPTVNEDTAYANNSFLPGAGYYHAPHGAWFPFAYNFHDPSRGYFRGGQWHRDREEPPVTPGSPSRTGGAHTAGFVSSSRPSPEAVQRANAAAASHHANTIKRGGFGGSARPSFS